VRRKVIAGGFALDGVRADSSLLPPQNLAELAWKESNIIVDDR
jgi:hypothetical protein